MRVWSSRTSGLIVFSMLLSFTVAASTPARAADAVLEWNQIALSATVTAAQGPNPQTRSMAIVHVAVHDAVNAITREYDTYLNIGRGPWDGSPEAAAIGAAHYALVNLFPSQAAALNAARATSLASRGLTDADAGVPFGQAVAAQILALRATDGAAQAQFPYAAPGAGSPGVWVPLGAAPAVLPGWGSVTPWSLRYGSQFRPDGPPALTSRRYARDFNEVKEIGAANSATRTSEQTEIARFWLGTPSAIWNGVARNMIAARSLDLSNAARVFALMYLAASDAGVACWDAKYVYNFWRPTTAIRNADSDDNDHTLSDPAWTPLFTTPQHPEYVSGHATNSSAMATVLITLFGDDPGVPIVATSPTNPTFPRVWPTFSDGIEEVIDARIYSGFHFRTSMERGSTLGRKVARFVINHELRERKGRRD
jgi:hypothetical protein